MQYQLTRCIVCGSSDSAELADNEAIRREAELLWSFHTKRLAPSTPPDRLVDRVAFSEPTPWRVVRCSSCGLVYRNPVERPQELRDLYDSDGQSRTTLELLHAAHLPKAREQIKRLTSLLGRAGSGIEIGSYTGAFLSAATRAGWHFEGVDVNPHVNDFVRSLDLIVHDGAVTELEFDGVVDVVAIWNTFDQLAEPRAVLRKVQQLLRRDGILAIRVPNGARYSDWRQQLDRRRVKQAIATAALAHNNLLTFPYRFGFTPGSLARLLREFGFVVELVVRDSLVRTSDRWTKRWARVEQRFVQSLTKRFAPWFEIYARKQN